MRSSTKSPLLAQLTCKPDGVGSLLIRSVSYILNGIVGYLINLLLCIEKLPEGLI